MDESNSNESMEARKYLRYVQKFEEANVYWSEVRRTYSGIAADFGKAGLQAVLLLNGAALGVLPALLASADIERSEISHAAGWFVVGIVCSVLAFLFAYFNYSQLADIEVPRAKNLKDLAHQYGYPTPIDEDAETTDGKSRRYDAEVELTRWVAVFLCMGAFAAFVKGVHVLL